MSLDMAREKIRQIRFKKINRRTNTEADLFIGQWLNLKIAIAQRNSLKVIKRQERELEQFFTQKAIQALLDENRALAEKVIFENIVDSAKIYQESCATDSHYGSKLFNLLKMKADEVASKAGDEVYHLIVPALLEMTDTFWRNQMLAAIHIAYQEAFGKEALKAEYFFDDQITYDQFDKIVSQTLARYGDNKSLDE